MWIWILRKRKWDGNWKPYSASFDREILLAEVEGQDPKDWDITTVPVVK